MSKILLNNFQSAPQIITAKPTDYKDGDVDFIVGFSIERDKNEARLDLISDIISSLLIFDKLVVPVYDLSLLIKALKEGDILKLLRNDTIQIIDDLNFNPAITTRNKIAFKAGSIHLVGPDEGGKGTLSDLEEKWQTRKLLPKNLLDQLLLLVAKRMKAINIENVGRMIKNETDYDLRNNNLTSRMRITSISSDNINPNDFYKILRLMHINKGLAFATTMGIDTTLIDSEIQPILNDKIAPIFLKNTSHEAVDIFQNILINKGLPDLGYIYDKGIISIDDIMTLRDNINGVIFRKWYASTDYNPQEALKALLNRVENRLQNIAAKHIRWLYPKIIGLVNPVAGIATSYVDSFVIDKILKGWHPSFFLDNKLKSLLDSKIKYYEKQKFLEEIKKKYPNIERNDLCPCGSGKKFKKCCGR